MTAGARAGQAVRAANRAPYIYAFVVPGMAAVGLGLGGWWAFLGPAYALSVNVSIDAMCGNRFGPPPTVVTRQAEIILWLALPTQAALLVLGLSCAASAAMSSAMSSAISAVALVGVALAVGVSGATFGLAAAHELVHRQSGRERGLGVCLLMLVSHAHFRIEHVHNHHRAAATPADPATARLGESLYAFCLRSSVGQVAGAWRAETRGLARTGRPWWHRSNRMLAYAGLQAALHAAVFAAFGWVAWLVFLAQGMIAVFLLEVVNYVAHYGLERREVAPGRYEPFSHRHAWNSGHPSTDFGLLNLGRHSAHHSRTDQRFTALGNPPEAPQLPTGYVGSVLLALVPPLWRRVMDPRVMAVRGDPRSPISD